MESLPDSNVVGLRPSPNSPSDISYSSGIPSVVSTRETSPASSTHHPLDAAPSGSPPLQDLPGQIPSDPRKALEMDYGPFQTINIRPNKVTGEVSQASHASSGIIAGGASSFGPLQQRTGLPLAPNAPPHPSASLTTSSAASQGLYYQNWRTTTASLENPIFPSLATSSAGASPSASYSTNTNNFAATSGCSILSSPVSPVGFGSDLKNNNNRLLGSNGYLSIANLSTVNLADNPYSAARDHHHMLSDHHLDTVTDNLAKMHPTSGSFISEADMDRAMGYCYDRGDGQYTRLVAVDLLPVDLRDIPRRVASDQGMIVLPIPRMPGPNGQPADNQLEPQAAVTPPPSSPSDNTSTDLIQTRIDTIVACSPQKASSPTAAGGALVPSSAAVANRAPGGGPGPGRRDKIYCDKWIHDGTCAFTQQGCKFKHEMPNDKETQEKLGLFHGYPAWWKKLLAEQQRPTAIDDRPVSIAAGRRGAGASGGAGGASAGGGGDLTIGPAYTSTWRPLQHAPVHQSEALEDVRHTGFGTGGGGRGGVGFGSRGSSRQGRGGASSSSFNAPNYGPIGPPSRLPGRATSRGGNRGPAGPSASNNGFAAPRNSEANLYAALMDLSQGCDDDAAAENGGGTNGEDEEQRGAKL